MLENVLVMTIRVYRPEIFVRSFEHPDLKFRSVVLCFFVIFILYLFLYLYYFKVLVYFSILELLSLLKRCYFELVQSQPFAV